MTTEEERKKEFMERCVDREGKATRVDNPADRRREAKRFRALSEYHGKAVSDHLDGEALLMAIEEGYYVMLHKANEALVLSGFKPSTHECTLLGLRGIFNSPQLANDLRRAFRERKNVDYYINPGKPELKEFKNPDDFVNQTMNPFISKINKIIEEEFDEYEGER